MYSSCVACVFVFRIRARVLVCAGVQVCVCVLVRVCVSVNVSSFGACPVVRRGKGCSFNWCSVRLCWLVFVY